jgi:hypothetical protein
MKGNEPMEPTITQNGALYLAQHRKTINQLEYFQRMRNAALSQGAAVRTLRTLRHSPPPHSDNGR